jgi:hypothetical protein
MRCPRSSPLPLLPILLALGLAVSVPTMLELGVPDARALVRAARSSASAPTGPLGERILLVSAHSASVERLTLSLSAAAPTLPLYTVVIREHPSTLDHLTRLARPGWRELVRSYGYAALPLEITVDNLGHIVAITPH